MSKINSRNRIFFIKNILFSIIAFSCFTTSLQAQFVHSGITHKKTDLDHMKYMVEAQIDSWYSSYQEMASDSKSSFNYNVQGNSSFTVLARDAPRTNYNTWNNLQSVTSNGTYDGWSARDIQDFKDMLIYPGYSTTSVPSENTTFYWKGYQGNPFRHGNQGLSGLRTIMGIGIFLDNEIIYGRVLRYVKGESHRSDDLAYPSGPNTSTSVSSSGTFADTYNINRDNSIEDYGYDEVMANYIYENGQCQERSRDHQHTAYGIGNLNPIA